MSAEVSMKKDWRSGIYCLRVPVPGGKNYKYVPTGERDLKRARAVVTEYGADRIVHLANAEAVTAKTIGIVTLGRNFTCRQLFDLWKERLAVVVAPRSAETYGSHMASFFDGLECWAKPLAWVKEIHLSEWVNADLSRLETCRGRLVAARSLFKFAEDKGVVPGNPANLVRVAHRDMTIEQMERRPMRPFTEEEYLRFIGCAKVEQFWRDWAVLSYCCGYRMKDCACMEWSSFTPTTILVFPKKSRNVLRLEIPLDDPLIMRPELRALIDRLAVAPRTHPAFIWPEHRETILGPHRFYFSMDIVRRLKWAGIASGAATGVTFHSLRRSCAVRLHAAGRTLEQIAERLGHSNTATTQIYTDTAANFPMR